MFGDSIAWMDLLSWATDYRKELIPDRGFDLENHGYLKQIYADVSPKAYGEWQKHGRLPSKDDAVREMVLYKSGQMGVSEYLLSFAMHACDRKKATVLYVFPNDGAVSDFSAARLGPAIEASPYLQSIIRDGGNTKGRRGADKVTLKRFRNRYLYFRGGHVKPDGNAAQLKSVDADVLILDELDEIDFRAPSIARKRLGHSQIGQIRLASTPTYYGIGIHAAYLETTRHRWAIKCLDCNHWQTVGINHCVTEYDDLERPREWHTDDDGNPILLCEWCGRPLPPEWLTGRSAPAEWVSDFPDREIIGYHITKFMSPVINLSDMLRALRSSDETVRKEATNQDLGEPYKPRGVGLTDDDLDELRRDYGLGSRAPCYMGVDVGTVLNVVIRAKEDTETGERKALFIGTVESFEEVGRLINRFKPLSCVIDALPETRKARELQGEFKRGQIWLCYYNGMTIGSKKEEPANWNYRERQVTVDRTRTLDSTYNLFFDGQNTLPADARDIDDYYQQVKAPVRTVEKMKDGNNVVRYIESGPDHYAHAENYCNIATMRPYVKASAGQLSY